MNHSTLNIIDLLGSTRIPRVRYKLQKGLYMIILSIQLVCMFKQRLATMMHLFASINFNDTVEQINYIKSENKKKISKRDRRWPAFSATEQSQQNNRDNEKDTDFVASDVFHSIKDHKDLPNVRFNSIPTAKYSPETNLKRSSCLRSSAINE